MFHYHQFTQFSVSLYTAGDKYVWMGVNNLIMGVCGNYLVDGCAVKQKLSTRYPQADFPCKIML